jgi:hypothetical protein
MNDNTNYEILKFKLYCLDNILSFLSHSKYCNAEGCYANKIYFSRFISKIYNITNITPDDDKNEQEISTELVNYILHISIII